MKDYLPLFTLLSGFALGVFYGITFTLWRLKQKRHRRRKYANYGAHYVGTPPPAEAEMVTELQAPGARKWMWN